MPLVNAAHLYCQVQGWEQQVWWCGRGGNSDFESGLVMLTFPCLFGT